MQRPRRAQRFLTPRHLVGVVCVVAMLAVSILPSLAHAQIPPGQFGADAAALVSSGGASEPIDRTVSFIAVNLIYPVVQLLGNILIALINILIAVASYNDFVNAEAVEKGWVVVRDVANMVFVAVLLIIAIGTILNSQTYRYNKLLRDLVIMAFLVNFSKFIAGVAIDIAQIITLTFVSAFRNAAAGNLTTAFGLRELLEIRSINASEVTGFTLVGAMLLALGLMTVAVIVVGFYVIVFLIRIVALWLLIVLSPLAYALRTFPQGQKYASEWWDNFTKYLICGPVLAFFLWLSLTVVAVSTDDDPLARQVAPPITGESAGNPAVEGLTGTIAGTITRISEVDNLLSFLVATLLLLTSLTMAQRLCGAAGKYAGDVGRRARRAALMATGVTAAVGVTRGGWRGARTIGRNLYNDTIGDVVHRARGGLLRRAESDGRGAGTLRFLSGRPPVERERARRERTDSLSKTLTDRVRQDVERGSNQALFREQVKLRGEKREDDARFEKARAQQVAEAAAGLPPVPRVKLERRRQENEWVKDLNELSKDELYSFLEEAGKDDTQQGFIKRAAGVRSAFARKDLDDFVRRKKGKADFEATHEFANEYLRAGSTPEGLDTLGDIGKLAKADNRAYWVGHTSEDSSGKLQFQNIGDAKAEHMRYLSSLEPAQAQKVTRGLVPTVKRKPLDPKTGHEDPNAKEVHKPEVFSGETQAALRTVYSSQRLSNLRNEPRANAEVMLGISASEIDGEKGVATTTEDNVKNLEFLLRTKPEAVMAYWQTIAPNEFKDTFRVKSLDASGNLKEYPAIDMSWWTKKQSADMPKSVNINNPPTAPAQSNQKASGKTNQPKDDNDAAAVAAGLAAGAAAAAAAGRRGGRTQPPPGPEDTPPGTPPAGSSPAGGPTRPSPGGPGSRSGGGAGAAPQTPRSPRPPRGPAAASAEGDELSGRVAQLEKNIEELRQQQAANPTADPSLAHRLEETERVLSDARSRQTSVSGEPSATPATTESLATPIQDTLEALRRDMVSGIEATNRIPELLQKIGDKLDRGTRERLGDAHATLQRELQTGAEGGPVTPGEARAKAEELLEQLLRVARRQDERAERPAAPVGEESIPENRPAAAPSETRAPGPIEAAEPGNAATASPSPSLPTEPVGSSSDSASPPRP